MKCSKCRLEYHELDKHNLCHYCRTTIKHYWCEDCPDRPDRPGLPPKEGGAPCEGRCAEKPTEDRP